MSVTGIDDAPLQGVASVGYRPMYPTERDVLEVYLFDFDRDIYQAHCSVTFHKKLRDEVNFLSEEELIAQIEKDVFEAREWLVNKKAPT